MDEKELKALEERIASMPIEEVIAQVERDYAKLMPEQRAFAKYLVEQEEKERHP